MPNQHTNKKPASQPQKATPENAVPSVAPKTPAELSSLTPPAKDDVERRLEALGKRVRMGWQKLHPVKEEDLARAREAARQQWEEEHPGQSVPKGQTAPKKQ